MARTMTALIAATSALIAARVYQQWGAAAVWCPLAGAIGLFGILAYRTGSDDEDQDRAGHEPQQAATSRPGPGQGLLRDRFRTKDLTRNCRSTALDRLVLVGPVLAFLEPQLPVADVVPTGLLSAHLYLPWSDTFSAQRYVPPRRESHKSGKYGRTD